MNRNLLASNPMLARKRGWKGLLTRTQGKVKSELPKYKLVVLISIGYALVTFFLRMAREFSRPQTLKSFRRELIDFLEFEESTYKTEVESLLQQLKGWEERISPQSAAQMIERQIPLLNKNPRVSELFFHLANSYYLAGDYQKYQSSFIRGLEELRNLRLKSPLGNLGVKFLFTEDWGWGIGHTTFLDPLIKLRELGLLSPQERVLVLSPEDGANKHYLRYWSKYLATLMVSKHEARHLSSITQRVSEKLSGFELKAGFLMLYEACSLAGYKWKKENREPLLKLDSLDSQRGWETLNRWGIKTGEWFVALHVREYNPYAPNHNRLRAGPNADIQTYFPAIRKIIDRGGWVIRMGDPSMSELPKLDRLVDYANSTDKSDWMDVFLWASCKFLIGTSSGPITVPPTFGVPVLYTNCCGIGFSPALGRSLVMPKLFRSRSENRLLTFREILAKPIGWTVRVPEDNDLELRDNSPEEIEMATDEMFVQEEAEERKSLGTSNFQGNFDQIRKIHGEHASTPISHSFASKYRQLLD